MERAREPRVLAPQLASKDLLPRSTLGPRLALLRRRDSQSFGNGVRTFGHADDHPIVPVDMNGGARVYFRRERAVQPLLLQAVSHARTATRPSCSCPVSRTPTCAWRSPGPAAPTGSRISHHMRCVDGAARSTTSARARSPKSLSSSVTRSGSRLTTTCTRSSTTASLIGGRRWRSCSPDAGTVRHGRCVPRCIPRARMVPLSRHVLYQVRPLLAAGHARRPQRSPNARGERCRSI